MQHNSGKLTTSKVIGFGITDFAETLNIQK